MDTLLAHRRRWSTLAVLSLSLLIIGMDTTVLNVALPRLATDLEASVSQLQWIVDAYTLAFAGLLLTAGAWGDKYGRRLALQAGLVVFGGASVWGAFASSAEMLIAARTVMGVGAALIMPSTLSILTSSFTDPTERKKAIGIWAGVSGIGIAVGPALGGWLLEHFWWGSVLLVFVPVAVAGIVLGTFLVPESRAADAPRLDVVGALLSIAGLGTLVWSIIEAPSYGWSHRTVLTGFGVAAVLLAGFIWWERRVQHPMLDVRYFQNRRFSVPAISITMVFFALFGSAFFLSIYLQTVAGNDPLAAGLRIMPLAVGLVLGAPLAMAVAQKVGEKIPTVTGLILLAASFVVITGTTVDSGYSRTLAAILLMGFGMSFAMGPATEAVMGSVPRSQAGVGSAVNDTTRQVGGALGVAVLVSILNSVYADRMAGAVRGLPAEIAAAASDNVQAAMGVAGQLSPEAGAALVQASFEAFAGAMSLTVAVAAGVVLVGAVIAAIWLPHHGVHPDDADPKVSQESEVERETVTVPA